MSDNRWEDLLTELQDSPGFRAEWDRLALARQVATWVIQYRVAHGLTQTAMARRLAMRQPQLARLEAADTEPKLETVRRVAEALGLEVSLTLGVGGVRIESRVVDAQAA